MRNRGNSSRAHRATVSILSRDVMSFSTGSFDDPLVCEDHVGLQANQFFRE